MTMLRTLATLVVIVLCSLLSPLAQAVTDQELVSQLQTTYQNTFSYQARFTQKTEVKVLDTVVVKTGTLLFSKPGQFIIHYKNPLEKKYISDGRSLWIYDEEDNQVQIVDEVRGAVTQEALVFLGGLGKVTQTFRVPKIKREKDCYLYSLIPKSDNSAMKKVVLAVHPQTYQITGVTLYPKSGNVSRYDFDQFKMNVKVKNKQFSFKPPKGSQVHHLD
jgi:outer membrane lipoprotein carrier protein